VYGAQGRASAQLELEHTVSLHLRSRRVGSDEAVYSIIDALATLAQRLAGRSQAAFVGASAAQRARHAHISQALNAAIDALTTSPMGLLVSACLRRCHGCCG
jgi:hypothetical protein